MLNDVCGIIVTFHPNHDVIANISKLRGQLQGLVVVDNGSQETTFSPIKELSRQLNFKIIENGNNLGIAAALNIGIRWAAQQGYKWVILFDQDSTVTEGFVSSMLCHALRYGSQDKIAIVAPHYTDRKSGKEMPLSKTRQGDILVARTSGSLMQTEIFSICGWFEDDFIIDYVDYEYCLRVKARGYQIIQCAQAELIHSLGELSWHPLWGGKLFSSTHHNSVRRYYVTRNRILTVRKYWKEFPAWCCEQLNCILRDCIKILLVEQPKSKKMLNTARGIRDGLLNRAGKAMIL